MELHRHATESADERAGVVKHEPIIFKVSEGNVGVTEINSSHRAFKIRLSRREVMNDSSGEISFRVPDVFDCVQAQVRYNACKQDAGDAPCA